MLFPHDKTAEVGVIVGRFQVHELHDGHKDLIESVMARHKRVIIFLGSTPDLICTRHNPLDFSTRRIMIHQNYPTVEIMPILDDPSDKTWSETLDRKIQEVVGSKSALLYGSRDGFIPAYSGKYETVELAERVHLSGTEVRESISQEVRESADFRRGIVYAAYNRYPTSYQVVDVAILKGNEVLLARKKTDPADRYRFIGGFVDVRDQSLNQAALREAKEETGLELSIDQYLGSFRVNDWRYRHEKDKVMTAFFLMTFQFGSPKPQDDICELKWFDLKADLPVIDNHQMLLKALMADKYGESYAFE